MADRFFPDKQIENAPVARPVSRRVLAWLGIVVVAGALLASGFIISARQHFEAISLGYQSEELRRQSTQLDEKLRQLELEYARAASPVEIEKRAEKIGLERPDKDKKMPDNPPVRPGPKKTEPLASASRPRKTATTQQQH